MKGMIRAVHLLGMLGLALAAPAGAATIGYVEDFSVDASGWTNSGGPLTWVASGGPDGGSYVSFNGPSINNPGTIQFRTSSAAASGGNFAGSWLSPGVSVLSAEVLHDAPAPVNVFFRITTGVNSPAIIGVVPVPVLPNTWTQVSLTLFPGNPLIIPEGPPSTYNTVLSSVTNVQVGFAVPVELEGTNFTYGLDKVTIVPEPATAGILASGLVLLAAGRRRARR
jgi:hypothetical protein